MKNKTELMHKPNQTIMITSNNISAMQRKAYNAILYKAWYDLKNDKNQKLFYFSIADLKTKAGLKATDNVKLKKGLKGLTTTGVEIIKDNGNWAVFTLLSYAEKDNDDELVIDLPIPIRQALIKNNFYTTLDLLKLRSLNSKYAIVLYEMAIRYSKTQIPELMIEEFKKLMGTENIKSYNNFARLKVKVIEPAVKEVNEKTDIILSFTLRKKGRKVIAIKFYIEKKEAEQNKSENLKVEEPKEKDEIEEIINNFRNVSGAELHPKRVEELVKKKGLDKVNKYIDDFDRFQKPGINDIASFFYKSVLEEYPLQKKSTGSNIPQYCNFEQRKYSKEYLQTLYEDV